MSDKTVKQHERTWLVRSFFLALSSMITASAFVTCFVMWLRTSWHLPHLLLKSVCLINFSLWKKTVLFIATFSWKHKLKLVWWFWHQLKKKQSKHNSPVVECRNNMAHIFLFNIPTSSVSNSKSKITAELISSLLQLQSAKLKIDVFN